MLERVTSARLTMTQWVDRCFYRDSFSPRYVLPENFLIYAREGNFCQAYDDTMSWLLLFQRQLFTKYVLPKTFFIYTREGNFSQAYNDTMSWSVLLQRQFFTNFTVCLDWDFFLFMLEGVNTPRLIMTQWVYLYFHRDSFLSWYVLTWH